MFEFSGIQPDRLAAIGYGEYYLIADNSTREGRTQNRRVVAVILAEIGEESDETLEQFEKAKNTAAPIL